MGEWWISGWWMDKKEGEGEGEKREFIYLADTLFLLLIVFILCCAVWP